RPRGRAQEGRPAQGPSRHPVLQALKPFACGADWFTIRLPQPRRQAVRHLTLTQAFGGSNPSGAAIFTKNPPKGGFFVAPSPATSLQTLVTIETIAPTPAYPFKYEASMKLGSLKEGGRDGTLIVVSRDLSRAVR